MTPQQQILAFELRQRGLTIDQIGAAIGYDPDALCRLFARNASKPLLVEVPRWMTPVFIRQSVCIIMKRYRSSE